MDHIPKGCVKADKNVIDKITSNPRGSRPFSRGPEFLRGVFFNPQKRNKLTASVLTFVMLFQIVAGIFAPVNIFNLNKPNVANAAWFNDGGTWQYRKSITVNHTKVPNTDQAYFPMLVSMNDESLKSVSNGGKVNSESGFDIAFTAQNGSTQLDHEIETYTPTTGELKAWVKIPILSASEDTVIYIYYGNDAITETEENKTGVWDDGGGNNFKMVQHMNQDPSGTAPQMLDSTQYANNGTSGGTMTSDDLAAGQVGGATSFDGADDYIKILNDNTFNTDDSKTIGVWMKAGTTGHSSVYPRLYEKMRTFYAYKADSIDAFYTRIWDGTTTGNGTIQNVWDNQWHYVVQVVDRSSQKMYSYKDGNLVFTDSNISDVGNTAYASDLQIGGNINGYLNGSLDEFRISGGVRSADWIATEYNNQSTPEEFYSLGIEEVSSPAALSSFTYRKALTIDHTKVSADLTDFPVLVNLPTDASLASHAQADGDDILFTSNDISWSTGNQNDKLAHEIEKYTTTTGELQAWVKIPQLSSTVDTVIYMYYGNGAVTTQQNKTAVWDANTKMVQHMNQTGTGQVGDYKDATQYGNNSINVTNQPISVTGQIDSAESFSSAGSNYIGISNNSNLSLDVLTISAFIKVGTNTSDNGIVSKTGGKYNYNLRITPTGSYPDAEFYDGATIRNLTCTQNIGNDNKFHYLAVTLGENRSANIYLDGMYCNSTNLSTLGDIKTSGDLYIGRKGTGGIFNGIIDEVRISNTARSADWIATEYNNQSQPTEFSTLGIEEVSSPVALSFFGYRKAITIDHTKVSGDLVNFPVLINFPTDASLAAHAQATGNDILFTLSSTAWNTGTTNNKLAHEIETYTTATGSLQSWVKIPQLSSTTDTIIYMYYGNGSVTTQQNKTAVWDTNTKMVQHMNQTGNSQVGDYKDST